MNWHGMEPYVTLDLPAKWPWEEAMKRIRVPEGMLSAGAQSVYPKVLAHEYQYGSPNCDKDFLEAALLWLSEHPQVPTDEQALDMYEQKKQFHGCFLPYEWIRWGASEWQRRCFQEEEPEIPEEIKDLLWTEDTQIHTKGECVNDKILIAYRKGLRKGEQK